MNKFNETWVNQGQYRPIQEALRQTFEIIEQKYECQEIIPIDPDELSFITSESNLNISEKILERLASIRQSGLSLGSVSKEPGGVVLVTGNLINNSTAICEVILKLILDDEGAMAIYSLKWKIETLILKLISQESKINGERLLNGRLSERDWCNLTCSAGLLTEAPLFLNGFPVFGLDEIAIKTKSLKKAEPELKLLVIDSLLLLPKCGPDPISSAIKRIRLLSQDLKLPILITLTDYRGINEVF